MDIAFSPLNYTILFVYLGLMLAIGVLFAGQQKTTTDFFLAGRRMPWLVVAMSMYASLTSAVTYMGLPGSAFQENIALIVVCVVSPLVAPLLIFFFYPVYRKMNVTTSYEFIAARFGRAARFSVSGLFILARLGWLGTVIYAPAMALSVATHLPLWMSIIMMGLIATAYTALGGLAADLWTDVVQFVIMIGGAVWIAVTLAQRVPEGVTGILRLASQTGRLGIFDHAFSLYEMSGVMVAITFSLQLLQDYGTDQTTVQRLMATRTFRDTAKAIVFNAATDFVIVGLLLFIGLGLFAYHTHYPEQLPSELGGDRLLPYYILHALPDGVSGLLITAIFAAAMSSMDSGINSIATVTVNDLVKPLRRRVADDRHDLALARWLTLLLGVFATGIAFYISTFDHLIKAYTSIISLFNAPVLALFLLGLFVRRTRFSGWLLGCAIAIPINLYLQYGTNIHWIYYFPASLTLCFAVALLVTWVRPDTSGLAAAPSL